MRRVVTACSQFKARADVTAAGCCLVVGHQLHGTAACASARALVAQVALVARGHTTPLRPAVYLCPPPPFPPCTPTRCQVWKSGYLYLKTRELLPDFKGPVQGYGPLQIPIDHAILGKVLWAGTDEPVAGAVVRAWEVPSAWEVWGSSRRLWGVAPLRKDGSFSIDYPPMKRWTIQLEVRPPAGGAGPAAPRSACWTGRPAGQLPCAARMHRMACHLAF